MKIEDIEVEIIIGENTPNIVTEEILKLYDNNAFKLSDIPIAILKSDVYKKEILNNKRNN